MAEQQQIWDDTLRESGPEFTRTYVAVPGCSSLTVPCTLTVSVFREGRSMYPIFPPTGP